jgi:hypothetical protein
MAENLGSYAVNIPKMFQSPGEALQAATAQEERFGQRLEQANFRNQQAEERKAKELEAQRQRSMAMIQSGVRLDRMPADEQAYMVAQDAVSKVKSNLMAKLNNKSIDPIALQTEIDDAMKGITRASNTFILEHNNIDEIVNQVGKNNPSVDVAALKNDLKTDVRNRRIAQGQFIDPNQVEDSALIAQLSNPENLSKYITEYNALDKVMSSKQSSTPIRAKLGTPQSYTTYGGQVGFWAKPTFQTDPRGFITGGKTPSMTDTGTEIANEPLPANSLKGVDKPLDMVPEGVYQKFTTDGGNQGKSEIIALAQKQFPTYKNFTPQEKEFANRNALYNYLKNKDRDGFAGIGEVGYNPPPSYAGQKSTEGERKSKVINDYLDGFADAIVSNDEITDASVKRLNDYAGKLFALGGGKSRFSKLVLQKDRVIIKYKNQGENEVPSDVFMRNDPDLRNKLTGAYQRMSGSENAAEIEILTTKNTGGKDSSKYSKEIEEKINIVIKNNPGSTRDEVIAELRKKGKL